MDLLFLIIILFLSFSNGANDNFKGVATVWGSALLDFRHALILANASTFLGSVCATVLGYRILAVFSGADLVPDAVLTNPDFASAFALGAAGTVFLATVLRLPISTTHALLGALVGTGAWFVGTSIDLAVLGPKAIVPLLVSPFLAAGLTFLAWRTLRAIGENGVGAKRLLLPRFAFATAKPPLMLSARSSIAETTPAPTPVEQPGAATPSWRIPDYLHVFSGCLVCFARGINDTPKIASLLLLGLISLDDTFWAFALVASGILLGGGLFSLRVATTISHEITNVPRRQGLVGNLVTAFLILFASKLGFPVSTTHVAVGSLIGIGITSQGGNWRRIRQILFSWVVTIPCAFGLAFCLGALVS